MSPAQTKISNTLREVVALLVQKKYDALENLTGGVRLKANEIEAGVLEYGRTLVFPPEAAFSAIDVIPIRDTSPAAYSIRFGLYTAEEGRSDLELRATLIDDGNSTVLMTVEFDDLLVA